LYANSAPHEGYNILRKWANRVQNLPKNDKRMAFFSFTSNVDGHWQRVVASDRLLECHGTVTHFQCVNNCTSDIWPDPGEPLEYSRVRPADTDSLIIKIMTFSKRKHFECFHRVHYQNANTATV
jgi:NAD-dependent SIR2 family protein deacetylase